MSYTTSLLIGGAILVVLLVVYFYAYPSNDSFQAGIRSSVMRNKQLNAVPAFVNEFNSAGDDASTRYSYGIMPRTLENKSPMAQTPSIMLGTLETRL